MAGTETLCGGSPAQRCVVSVYPRVSIYRIVCAGEGDPRMRERQSNVSYVIAHVFKTEILLNTKNAVGGYMLNE